MDDLISGWDLVDVNPIKGKYTWTNKRVRLGHITVRLDRFLIHNKLLLQDYTFKSKILPTTVSYHKPITLHFQSCPDYGPFPF
jgi:hypothetical protein